MPSSTLIHQAGEEAPRCQRCDRFIEEWRKDDPLLCEKCMADIGDDDESTEAFP